MSTVSLLAAYQSGHWLLAAHFPRTEWPTLVHIFKRNVPRHTAYLLHWQQTNTKCTDLGKMPNSLIPKLWHVWALKEPFSESHKNRGQNHTHSTYMNTVVDTVSAHLYSCFFIVCYIIFRWNYSHKWPNYVVTNIKHKWLLVHWSVVW